MNIRHRKAKNRGRPPRISLPLDPGYELGPGYEVAFFSACQPTTASGLASVEGK